MRALSKSIVIDIEGELAFGGVSLYVGRDEIKLVSRNTIENLREGDVVCIANPGMF